MRNLSVRILLIAAVTAGGTLGIATSGGAAGPSASQKTLVLTDCKRPKFRPSSIVVSCADEGIVFTKLHWEDWTTSGASGAGTARVNDCEPSCVLGKTRSYPVNVDLSVPKSCRRLGVRLFTKVAYEYPKSKPQGPRKDTSPLPCPRS